MATRNLYLLALGRDFLFEGIFESFLVRRALLLNPSQLAPAGVNLTGFTPCGRRLSTVALSSSSRRRTNYQSHFSLKSRLRPAAICTQIAFRNGTEMGRFVLEPAWVLG